MAARDQRGRAFEPLTRRHLYVSVYGARSTDEVVDRLFAAAHPTLNAWPVRLFAGAIRRGGNILTKGKAFADTDGQPPHAVPRACRAAWQIA
jgi:hypothetical protein